MKSSAKPDLLSRYEIKVPSEAGDEQQGRTSPCRTAAIACVASILRVHITARCQTRNVQIEMAYGMQQLRLHFESDLDGNVRGRHLHQRWPVQ